MAVRRPSWRGVAGMFFDGAQHFPAAHVEDNNPGYAPVIIDARSGRHTGHNGCIIRRPIERVDIDAGPRHQTSLVRGEIVNPKTVVLIIVIDEDLIIFCFFAVALLFCILIGSYECDRIAIVGPAETLDAARNIRERSSFSPCKAQEPKLHSGFIGMDIRLLEIRPFLASLD